MCLMTGVTSNMKQLRTSFKLQAPQQYILWKWVSVLIGKKCLCYILQIQKEISDTETLQIIIIYKTCELYGGSPIKQ